MYTQEKYSLNLVNSFQIRIVTTLFPLIFHRTEFFFAPNQSVHGKYNMISVWLNKLSKSLFVFYILRVRKFGLKKKIKLVTSNLNKLIHISMINYKIMFDTNNYLSQKYRNDSLKSSCWFPHELIHSQGYFPKYNFSIIA